MKFLRAALVLAACTIGAGALHAQQSCPAMSRADAGAALAALDSDSPQLNVAWHSGRNYTCTFTNGADQLVISIQPYIFQNGWESYTKKCPAATPVPGIGNEAVECKPSGAGTLELMSHVTDTYFEVKLTRAGDAQGEEESLRRTARVVAGNLR